MQLVRWNLQHFHLRPRNAVKPDGCQPKRTIRAIVCADLYAEEMPFVEKFPRALREKESLDLINAIDNPKIRVEHQSRSRAAGACNNRAQSRSIEQRISQFK